MRVRFALLAFPVCLFSTLVAIASCSSEPPRAQFEPGSDGREGGADTGPLIAPGAEAAAPRKARLTGTVFAPNGYLPVAGALVYLTDARPAPIPGNVYCDRCVTLPEKSFGYSGADGTFDFTAEIKNHKFLVVQKGQFRRVRELTFVDGINPIAKQNTTFPSARNEASGDDTPRIVVLQSPEGSYDPVELALQKLGITDFTLLNRDAKPTQILANPAELAKYHIVFIPCRERDEATAANETAKSNLRAYVNAGGKLYVTDHAYEYVRQPFPPFIRWDKETQVLGSAGGGSYDARANVTDPTLKAWLGALGHSTFDLQDNWTRIASVSPLPGKDEHGADVTITPKVWVEATVDGRTTPASVTFQQACGRVLFSTYHTEPESSPGSFMPQEKALFHVLLEVGVCLGEQPGQTPR